MRNRIYIAGGFLGVILLLWLGYAYGVKPTITIQTDTTPNVVISTGGKVIYDGQEKSIRVDPGAYIVRVTNGQGGISKQIEVGAFGNATVSIPASSLLNASLIAPAALYQAFPVGDSYIGFDPSDAKIKRIMPDGNITESLNPAINNAEPSLPDTVNDYQPYQRNQAIVSTNGLLYLVGNAGPKEINMTGITIDTATVPEYIIATQPQSAAFVVGYKHDLYWYDDAGSAPRKIYTAKKEFDRVVYGGKTIGIYDTRIPPSKQDLRPFYRNYQNDLLLIDTANGNSERTIDGPFSEVTLNPDGTFATIQPRFKEPYLYDIAKKQRVVSVDLPLAAGPYWTSATTYLFSQDAVVWQYDTTAQQSTLVGQLPATATAFYKDESGAIIVSAYNNAQSAGIYRLGEPTAATKAADTLKSALPFNDDSIGITYITIGGKPRVTITTKAPLNSASQMTRYKQETLQLRQRALDYLKAQKIDITTVDITYDPADPL